MPRRRRRVKRRLSILDLDFPQVQPTYPATELKPDELPRIETEGLTAIARLLEPVRSADELADLKMALNDALRIGKQTITTPRKPSGRPPEFVDEEEELM